MPAVGRSYLVALLLAGLLAVGFVVVPKIVSTIHAREARDDLAAANAAFGHLKVPSNYRLLSASNLNCVSGLLCYRVAEPTTSISEASLIAVLHTTGAVFDARSSHCSTLSLQGSTRLRSCFVYARLDGLYVSATLRGYDPRAPRRGLSGSAVWIFPPFTPSNN
jgi:hypothetical protein